MQTATETRRAMTITYRSNKALYVNLTNRCPCACTFCIRNNDLGVFGSDSLWLEREPTIEEVTASLDGQNLASFDEVVFCGYGEPTERLEILLAAAGHLKRRDASLRIRVNTNGLSDLVNGKPTAALFAGKVPPEVRRGGLSCDAQVRERGGCSRAGGRHDRGRRAGDEP